MPCNNEVSLIKQMLGALRESLKIDKWSSAKNKASASSLCIAVNKSIVVNVTETQASQ